MYQRKGSLFMSNFKRKVITDENYFTQLIAYIHCNPIHHGFCKEIFDWKFSSIHAYAFNNSSKVNKHYLINYFGDKKSLISFHLKYKNIKDVFDF